jgi:hypothetical protein
MSIAPPATDTDNAPPKKASKAKRTLVLWVVLVVMFVAIYSLMAPSAPRAAEAPVEQAPWILRTLPHVLPWAFVMFVMGFLVWNGKRARSYNRAVAPAMRALRQRRLADAEAGFIEHARVAGKAPFAGAVSHHNLAAVRLRRGDFDGAAADLAQVERWSGLGFASDLRVFAAASLAQTHALGGDVALARRWLEVAQRRLPKAVNPTDKLGAFVLAEALVLLREGKPREALALDDQHASELEGTVPYDSMRQWWALMAFARWQDAGPRDQGAVDMLLRRLQPSRPHELAHLVVEWPELRGFLETHGVPSDSLSRGS